MGKAAKPPESYHFQIATLQRLIAVTAKDLRISESDKRAVHNYVNGLTQILSALPALPEEGT